MADHAGTRTTRCPICALRSTPACPACGGTGEWTSRWTREDDTPTYEVEFVEAQRGLGL